jgi:hypothetical protein
MKLIDVDSKATLENFLNLKKRLNFGIMKIQIWSYLCKNVTNPEKNMLNK